MQYNNAGTESVKASIPSLLTAQSFPSTPNVPLTVIEQTKNYLSGFESLVNNHATLVVGLWFVVLCIQCLRLSISLGYTYHIRHYKIYTPATHWQALCTNLKNGFGIQRPVTLLESGIAKVPLVIGFFKPLILLPVGMLANLPYNQVESILLHELAHIRRSDYLVNLFQALIETVFFYNPAILWISALIKEEREACCDAVAVKRLDSKSHYIQALVSFQEYTANSPHYALAFPGRKDHLLQRVKRIISNENKKLSSMEKLLLFCGIVAIALVTMLSAKESKAQKNVPAVSIVPVTYKRDTTPDRPNQTRPSTNSRKQTQTRVTTDDNGTEKLVLLEDKDENGRELKAKFKNNAVVEISVNGKSIPREDFDKYESEVKSIIEKQQAQADVTQKLVSQKRPKSDNLKEENTVQSIQQANPKAEEQENAAQPKEGDVQVTYKSTGSEDVHQQVEGILAVLKAVNIIKGKEGTTFNLTNNELLVNGVKQPDQLHQQLRQKYIYKAGDFINFYSDGKRTDIGTHRE
jgi:beta-lactamase regulating signal transducer with metallopeptidase domain